MREQVFEFRYLATILSSIVYCRLANQSITPVLTVRHEVEEVLERLSITSSTMYFGVGLSSLGLCIDARRIVLL